ncbi:MAG TPA: hypothetical protein VLB01_03945 [Thermodesulfobacteriota bacterium]|nr:hypothetical protein [Thermodesulfobacteriota bacterium]
MLRKFAQAVIIALVALTTIVLTERNSSALAKEFDHAHPIYNSLLNKYVHNAKVDYKGFIESKEKFQTVFSSLTLHRLNCRLE